MVNFLRQRIGNVFENGDKYWAISSICTTEPIGKVGFRPLGFTDLEITLNEDEVKSMNPVYLTQPILEQCDYGAELRIEHQFGFLYKNQQTILPDLLVYYKDALIKEILYVHELQNLYFALYDKEMLIKTLVR